MNTEYIIEVCETTERECEGPKRGSEEEQEAQELGDDEV